MDSVVRKPDGCDTIRLFLEYRKKSTKSNPVSRICYRRQNLISDRTGFEEK